MSKKPLAGAIFMLRVALEGIEADALGEANLILAAVDSALVSASPEQALNSSFGQLRRFNPGIFFRLNRWLNRAAVRSTASKAGAHWAWRIWRRATVMMHRNKVRASVAFDMNRNGRPPPLLLLPRRRCATALASDKPCSPVCGLQAATSSPPAPRQRLRH